MKEVWEEVKLCVYLKINAIVNYRKNETDTGWDTAVFEMRTSHKKGKKVDFNYVKCNMIPLGKYFIVVLSRSYAV